MEKNNNQNMSSFVKQLTTLYQETASLGLRATLEYQQSADKAINAWTKLGLESTQAVASVVRNQQEAGQQVRQEWIKQAITVTNQAVTLDNPWSQEFTQWEAKTRESAQKMTELFTASFSEASAGAKR